MKEALLYNECFVESVVESEAASSSSQSEQFDHGVRRLSSANCNTPVVGRILVSGMFAVAKSVRMSTKYETTCHEHHIDSEFAEVAAFRTPMIV